MKLIRRAEVHEGQLTFLPPLPLPEGMEVTVEITAPERAGGGAMSAEEFMTLPVFGMWADREDMRDSLAWVDKERRQWQERLRRSD
jgi:hypothetical protein